MTKHIISILLCIPLLLTMFSCSSSHTDIPAQTLDDTDIDINNAHEINIKEFTDFFDREGFTYGISQASFHELITKYKINGIALDTSGGMFYDSAYGGGWDGGDKLWSASNDYTSDDGINIKYTNSFTFLTDLEGMSMAYNIKIGQSLSEVFALIGIDADAEQLMGSDEAKKELYVYKSDNTSISLVPTLKADEITSYTISYAKKEGVELVNAKDYIVTSTLELKFTNTDSAWTLHSVTIEVKQNYKKIK